MYGGLEVWGAGGVFALISGQIMFSVLFVLYVRSVDCRMLQTPMLLPLEPAGGALSAYSVCAFVSCVWHTSP